MTRAALALVVVLASCGGRSAQPAGPVAAPRPAATTAERMIALLPDGAQILVELDLARLRANPVVGDVATRALGRLGAEVGSAGDALVPGLPTDVQESPLARAERLVLAAYGVGTDAAATVLLLETKDELEGAARLLDDFVALGPPEWVRQVEARAGIALREPLVPSLSLMSLRDHAMPEQAPGAVVRVTARLPFDARVALARQLGIDTAPAQLSVWGDVVDDLAIVIDADAADPGEARAKDATRRLARALQRFIAEAAAEPELRALGLAGALRDARMITDRTWVRTVITIGPRQLARAAERARAMLAPAS